MHEFLAPGNVADRLLSALTRAIPNGSAVVARPAQLSSVADGFDCPVPDFVVYRDTECVGRRVRADDVLLVGEILSPSKTRSDLEARKGPYSDAGILCYWEVATARTGSAIEMVRAYALAVGHGPLPGGARPLRPANYLVIEEWTVADANGIRTSFPFPMEISWSELAP